MARGTKSNARCREKNAFVTGSVNFQKSALNRHITSDDHKLALAAEKQGADFDTAVENAREISAEALYAQMGAALILATDDLPDRKFASLLHAQVGCINVM